MSRCSTTLLETTQLQAKRRFALWVLTALAALAFAPPAAAAEVEVGPFVGLHVFDGKNELGQPEGLSAGLTDTLLYGLRGTFWLWRYAGVEIEAAAGAATMTIHEGAQLSTSPTSLLTGRAQLIGRLPIGRLSLLGLIGGGAIRTFPDVVSDSSQDTDAFSHVGVGVEVGLWRGLRLRADARIAATGSTVPDASFAFDKEANLGLSWRFGAAAAPKDDADHDGVDDETDLCPYEAETVNGVRDDDGCPEDPVIAQRHHKTRYVREDGDIRARLAKTAVAPPPSAATKPDATKPAEAKPLPAAPTRSDDAALDDLGEAAPLASDALPPLVSAGDDDGDGLDRDEDVCPAEPEDIDGFEDEDGCPDLDNDRDGVPDDSDLCPLESETINGVRDEDGCPEDPSQVVRYHRTRFAKPAKARDTDVAIVPEKAQRIERGKPRPEEADLKVLPEPEALAVGALPPLVSAGDDDGDGIVRDDDVCPSEAEDLDGFEDSDGCPDLDDDRDGIADAVDRCRRESEVHNGFEDEDGCPDEVPMPLLERVGRIEGLLFGNNSARILPQSEAALRHLLDILRRFPSIQVEIAGHTDDRGNRNSNKMLSLLRAESVRAWLVLHGTSPARIRARGYGPDTPIASNRSEQGRAANRRVEFNLVRGDDAENRREKSTNQEEQP